ncbi:MAG TPA: hypothetical protein V6C76_09005 [Drouetiella sp.]
MFRSGLKINSTALLERSFAAAICVLSASAAFAQEGQSPAPAAKPPGTKPLVRPELDPLSESILARSKEKSQTAESSAITNFQRGVACEKMGQKQAALQFFDKAVLLIRDNPTNYDPKFIQQAYETYAGALQKAGNPKLAKVILEALNRSQTSQATAPNNSAE